MFLDNRNNTPKINKYLLNTVFNPLKILFQFMFFVLDNKGLINKHTPIK